MSEKVLMIVNATPNPKEQEAYEYYASHVGPIFKQFGGMPFAKYKVSETIVGNQAIQVVAIMQFPNDNAIKNAFDSEAYKSLLPYRNKAFSNLTVLISKTI